MNKKNIAAFLLFSSVSLAYAECDLSEFRWDCDLITQKKPVPGATSMVSCGFAHGYLSKEQYRIMARNLREHINMALYINGEYVDSPCLQGQR